MEDIQKAELQARHDEQGKIVNGEREREIARFISLIDFYIIGPSLKTPSMYHTTRE